MRRDVNLNAIDFGATFLPQNQDLTLTRARLPARPRSSTDLMRAIRGYGAITQQHQPRLEHLSLDPGVVQAPVPATACRSGSTTRSACRTSAARRRACSTTRTARTSYRADQAEADELLGRPTPQPPHHEGELRLGSAGPQERHGRALKAIGLVVNDWQLSGIWTASTGAPYTVGFSYQNGGGNVNLTGSPDYGARIRVVGDPGRAAAARTRTASSTRRVRGRWSAASARVRQRLPARLLPQRARPGDNAKSRWQRTMPPLASYMFNAPNRR